jgi:hypothetical protein
MSLGLGWMLRLRVFENRVLRRMIRAKRDEVTGGWRKLHNEEHRDLYSSPSIIRMKWKRMRSAGHVARMGEKRNAHSLLMGKPEGKRLLGRPRRRWVDNIRMDLAEIGWGSVDWICLAQDRDKWRAIVNAVINCQFHKMQRNCYVASQLVASRVVLSSIEMV